jgi:predicted TIM-barrel fold metal-dependent hydrolase
MEDMDKNGTQTAILSLTTPGLWFAPTDAIRKVVRECNEYASKLCGDHPGRFGSFASIYPPDTEGALKETEYALDTLKAEGIALYSDYRDKWLGNEAFNPVYEELNRRKAVVYVHPIESACCMNCPGRARHGDLVWHRHHAHHRQPDFKRFDDTLSRHHVDLLAWRRRDAVCDRALCIGNHDRSRAGNRHQGPGRGAAGQGSQGVLYELRKMYYDTAQASNPVAVGALRKVVPVSQIVYGTDYWYRTAGESGRGLTTNGVFNAEELKAINRGNAERILPRYKGV